MTAPDKTWGDLCAEWKRAKRFKKSIGTDIERLAWIATEWEPCLLLYMINVDAVTALLRAKEAEGVLRGNTKRRTPTSPATINRYWALISGMLNLANQMGWIGTVPRWKPYSLADNERRYLTEEEASRLLDALPEYLQAMARFSLATGLRKANVRGLQVAHLDIAKRHAFVPGGGSKSGRPIAVPLNDEAMSAVLESIGGGGEYVFKFRGDPAGSAWRAACKRAGLVGVRWHDLRHTWASWHVQRGTPLPVLQKLGGWSSLDMVLHYAHLAPDHLAAYSKNGGLNGRA